MLDLTDNLVGRRGRAAGRGAGARHGPRRRTSWWPPTRAPRTSPTPPTRSASSTGTGWATRSPRAGPPGYDHKALGITAKGAWESVKRHFRELGRDVDDGAVHGCRHRRHVGRRLRQRHAAVARRSGWWRRSTTATCSSTPTPIAAPSLRRAAAAVRARRLVVGRLRPGADLDGRRRLAADGQVGAAVATRRARRWASTAESMPPTELCQAVLRAPVDLFWNGGIGTFVKAESESNADVGDRANDALRVERRRAARAGGRRGRQPGLHPARPHRVRDGRRPHQHGRDRQLGRRRLLRPRGQPEDPARHCRSAPAS